MSKIFQRKDFTFKKTQHVLKFDDDNQAYILSSPSERSVAFSGDNSDFFNIKLGNYEEIQTKYNLKETDFGFFDHYSTGKQNAIVGNVIEIGEKNQMPKGIYNLVNLDFGLYGFRPLTVKTDEFVDFDNSEIKSFQTKLVEFFKNGEKYKAHGARHKGAALLYGPPGGGKSTCILNSIQDLAKDTYCIFISKSVDLSTLTEFKECFSDNNVIIILEEITERLNQGSEDLLNFLDGYSSWESCYVIATTNYPENMAPNLVSRPGRFNHLIEVKAPTDAHKTQFLLKKGFEQNEIDKIILKTKDYSLDDIAQIAIQCKINDLNLDEYIKEVDTIKKKVKSAFKGKSSVGV